MVYYALVGWINVGTDVRRLCAFFSVNSEAVSCEHLCVCASEQQWEKKKCCVVTQEEF